MKVFAGQHVPIKSWCPDPEEEALKQARDLAALPFVFKQVCLMPDAHSGYGMPIGGVAACENVVIPNAVGVDIGCGMSTARTTLRELDIETLKRILSAIRKAVPVGFEHHKKNQPWDEFQKAPDIPIIQQELSSAKKQLGTLGGGNHFIELQKGSDGFIWIMVHSGSRNFGYKIAKEYNHIAQEINRRRFPEMPQYTGEGGLAFLPDDTREFHDYIAAMEFALRFACRNRELMIERIKEIFTDRTGCHFDPMINIHHNYARQENHFGKSVWVHRKGATSAREEEWGIIPGSQGTASFLVQGKGNPESFQSCSHGAGRRMSRHQARKTLNLEHERQSLDRQGILHSIRSARDLDEASSAYKNIDTVMENQHDLVDMKIKLFPRAVIKG